ncbi:MAG: hypothetical protein A2Y78_15020 [Acidobacteria bacterium RBG_13_68_16]|jgi:hypothetical protein|nr:MAG: hypothetical protein A2Y78_15020 [Acidobacteria bacterium RBG_13_68_16]
MKDPDVNDELSRFEAELRAWGARPARTSASVARTQVTARLPLVCEPIPWLRLAASAALVVVLAVATWLGAPRASREGKASVHGESPPPIDPNVVVWVMDTRTTVYFVLGPDGSTKGGMS